MAPFFASNSITRPGDLPITPSLFIPRPDFPAGGSSAAKDPRSPVTGLCPRPLGKNIRPILRIDTTCADAERIKAWGAGSLVARQCPYPVDMPRLCKQTRPILCIDTTCADAHRIKALGADSLVARQCAYPVSMPRPFQDPALDSAIQRVYKEMEQLSPTLPSSDMLSYGSSFGIDIPGEGAATADKEDESAVSSLDITTKKRSWKTGNLNDTGVGAWPEKKLKKVRTHTLQADGDVAATQATPHSADITDEKRVLRVVNPDPASGKSSTRSASFGRNAAPEVESPFVDLCWRTPQYSQRVADSMRDFHITASSNPRSVEEPVSPKSGPRRGTVARVPSVMQPRHRHSCYACSHKREMAEMAGKKG